MNVTKKMIEDLFNVITSVLDAVAHVDPDAKSLTTKQLIVDVLAKTMDSLKADIESYFINSDDSAASLSAEDAEKVIAQAKAIVAQANLGADDSTFEKIWSIAGPVLNLIEDTAKANLPKNSTALDAIITAIDAISALGSQLAIDLPKLNASS